MPDGTVPAAEVAGWLKREGFNESDRSPGSRTGTVSIPASKSQAHRLLICAALGQAPVTIRCLGISKDIAATIGCLNALGAEIAVSGDLITANPLKPYRRTVPSSLRGKRLSPCAFFCRWQGAWVPAWPFTWRGACPSVRCIRWMRC